ncbi:MAG TPA: ATP-binding protein [Longimicrobiales bacterium]|nr:ATP-binding protein [Longimicrobiales bacterium]
MEIRLNSELSVSEETLLDMHSVLNVMNVIVYELMNLNEALKDCPEIDTLTDATVRIAGTLTDPEEAYRQVANVDGYVARVRGELGRVLRERGVEESPWYRDRMGNLESIFTVLQVRAAELMARHANPDAWVTYPIAQLRESLWTVFRAIEQNSRGGYRIVANLAEHEEGDYLVHLDITSRFRGEVHMPAVFQDVMRDLLANARKYTQPGGTITAGLHDSGTELRLVVADTGRGIPPGEVLSVVEFGRRGSNTQDRPTRGAGIGLTKAYHVTRKFGGRMFIQSTGVPGEGTRIEIRLPLPAALAQPA